MLPQLEGPTTWCGLMPTSPEPAITSNSVCPWYAAADGFWWTMYCGGAGPTPRTDGDAAAHTSAVCAEWAKRSGIRTTLLPIRDGILTIERWRIEREEISQYFGHGFAASFNKSLT